MGRNVEKPNRERAGQKAFRRVVARSEDSRICEAHAGWNLEPATCRKGDNRKNQGTEAKVMRLVNRGSWLKHRPQRCQWKAIVGLGENINLQDRNACWTGYGTVSERC